MILQHKPTQQTRRLFGVILAMAILPFALQTQGNTAEPQTGQPEITEELEPDEAVLLPIQILPPNGIPPLPPGAGFPGQPFQPAPGGVLFPPCLPMQLPPAIQKQMQEMDALQTKYNTLKRRQEKTLKKLVELAKNAKNLADIKKLNQLGKEVAQLEKEANAAHEKIETVIIQTMEMNEGHAMQAFPMQPPIGGTPIPGPGRQEMPLPFEPPEEPLEEVEPITTGG